MPGIYDNISARLLPALKQTLADSERADFSVGYFNLRGWKLIDDLVDQLEGTEASRVRLLVGMHRAPEDELRSAMSMLQDGDGISLQKANRLRRQVAEEFRQQLVLGTPSNSDEAALRRLRRQLLSRQVVVKLYLRTPLHAKLYLCYKNDVNVPVVGFVGSSNLTFAGLSNQGELNVDVLDQDAAKKLSLWFQERWSDRFCIDITDELAALIEDSWAGEELIDPYLIYLKMAYHLSREARAGISEFKLPKEFDDELFDFQSAAVKIAAHHLNKRGGVVIGDVVGLGKTLMATALARVFEDDHGLETLIICPKNLIKMWNDYRHQYRLRATVLSISQVQSHLADMPRHRLVVIDESHNLRNSEGRRYGVIKDYINKNDSKCILLSATPYNKTYLDLSAQLALFVPPDANLGIRPERLLHEMGEIEFSSKHQAPVRSLAAFEHSTHADDWRELMRLYLVRRTRGFIKENYASTDPADGRKYLTFKDGKRSYFPDRVPRTVRFKIDPDSEDDLYGRLFGNDVVTTINDLSLPRYGLGNYAVTGNKSKNAVALSNEQDKTLEGLSRAGKRLMGFCRTSLFKRLESSGPVFIQSLERHALRNHVFLHALDNDLDVPIGTQESALLEGQAALNPETSDVDQEVFDVTNNASNLWSRQDELSSSQSAGAATATALLTSAPTRTIDRRSAYRSRAKVVYDEYASKRKASYKWLPAALFDKRLADDLRDDADALIDVLDRYGDWDPTKDRKLEELGKLLMVDHPNEKVLVFTQFADTVGYLTEQLKRRGVDSLEGVTGNSENPTGLAWRFSPESNEKRDEVPRSEELRVLVSTDVLSEGQNLQDCSIVVNFDLPWAIIQLIQRAGRVDRIGQEAREITCYSFLPADGVEQIISLRSRVTARLKESADVLGADDIFFDEDTSSSLLEDLYNEKAGTLDGDDDGEVDLASQAFQIWKNAIERDPSLKKRVEGLPDVLYSTRHHEGTAQNPAGVLLYMRTQDGNDALTWMDDNGENVTQSQVRILEMARCEPDTPPMPRKDNHHELVAKGAEHIVSEEKSVGGQLGRPSGARYKTYMRLNAYAQKVRNTLFHTPELKGTIEDIFRYQLRQAAVDTLNRQLRSGVGDEELAKLCMGLRDEDRLCIVENESGKREPQIICSLGLSDGTAASSNGGETQ